MVRRSGGTSRFVYWVGSFECTKAGRSVTEFVADAETKALEQGYRAAKKSPKHLTLGAVPSPYAAHSTASNSACFMIVCTAFSALSGG